MLVGTEGLHVMKEGAKHPFLSIPAELAYGAFKALVQ